MMTDGQTKDGLFRETLAGGTAVYTDAVHRVCTDSLLLAGFCRFSPKDSLIDLGAGCGILALALIDRGLEGPVVCVEQDAAAAGLLARAAEQDSCANLQVCRQDLRTYAPKHQFDIAVANPPYHAAGPLPQNPARAKARHQTGCTLEEVCRAAGRALRQKGRFYFCLPPARLAAAMAGLCAWGLAPKRLQPVRKSPGANAGLLLIEAVKEGGEGLVVLPDILTGDTP